MMNRAPAIAVEQLVNESRREPRTHLFVVATLYAQDGSSPAHIRNLSATGALIEASVLPEPGADVGLKRGSLEARGKLAWKVGRKAGIAFNASVVVEDWLPTKAGSGQTKVDKIVADFKAQRGPGIEPVDGIAKSTITIELMLLQQDLTKLEDSLTADPALVATHPELQHLDIAIQRIGRIMNQLSPGQTAVRG